MELLLANGARFKTDEPLLRAVLTNDRNSAEALLLGGADPNTVTEDRQTVLYWAALLKRMEIVELLLNHGASVHIARWVPLHLAAKYGDMELAELLLAHGADPNGKCEEGNTALICSAEEGQAAMVELLIDRGADPNLAHDRGFLPFCLAIMQEHYDVVEILIAKGADVNKPDPGTGTPPLCWAVYAEGVALAELLLANGADINVLDSDGRTALLLAKESGLPVTVEFLIAHGALNPTV